MIMAELSIAIFVCITILVIAFPWHWNFIMSRAAMLALAMGAVAYIGMFSSFIRNRSSITVPFSGFDVSKRIQRVALAVQTLYMHYFLFIWAWNDLKAFLTHVAKTDDSVRQEQDLRTFVSSFQDSVRHPILEPTSSLTRFPTSSTGKRKNCYSCRCGYLLHKHTAPSKISSFGGRLVASLLGGGTHERKLPINHHYCQ